LNDEVLEERGRFVTEEGAWPTCEDRSEPVLPQAVRGRIESEGARVKPVKPAGSAASGNGIPTEPNVE
jgi:hypothetical protein